MNKLFLLRFSDFHGVDTVAEHEAIIKATGRCWWAKLRKQPGEQYLEEFLLQEEKTVLLYKPGALFRCKLDRTIRTTPSDSFPEYYTRDIFGKDNAGILYFELLSMEKLDLPFLDDYVVCASGKPVVYDLKKTISSYMFIQDKTIPIPEKPKRIPKPKVIVDKKDCVYRIDGICTRKSCVFYSEECTRPQYCMKQKPRKIIVTEES